MPSSLENLRPMTVPDMLDAAFRLYRKNFWLLIKIYAVLYLPLNILLIPVVSIVSRNPGEFSSIDILLYSVQYLLSLVNTAVGWIAMGAIVKAVSATFLEQNANLRGCYQFIRPKVLALLVTMFLFYVLIGVGTCACLVPGLILGIWFLFVTQIIVLEGLDYVAALKRSYRLVDGYFWKVAGAMVLSLLLGYVIMGVIMAPGMAMVSVGGVLTVMSGDNAQPEMNPWLMAGLMLNSVIANLLFFPYLGIIITLLYYDLRIRKEGLDLELMAQEAGYSSPSAREIGVSETGEPER